MDPRQERKDQVYRRRTWRLLGLATAVGALGLLGFELWLRNMAANSGAALAQASDQVMLITHLLQLAISALLLLIGNYLIDLGRQALDQNQWPPAGIQTLSKRPPRHGDDARRVARRLKSAGAGAIMLAVALAAWTGFRMLA